jgi:hypothetical protein
LFDIELFIGTLKRGEFCEFKKIEIKYAFEEEEMVVLVNILNIMFEYVSTSNLSLNFYGPGGSNSQE